MKLKNLTCAALLLLVAGCGCNDDSFPPGTGPQVIRAVMGVGTDAPGLALAAASRKVPVDVFFLLDDGQFMEFETLGVTPFQPGDDRTHSHAAQRIMNNLQQRLQDRVGALIDAGPVLPGMTKADLDFAFGVGRYEDFGGPFARRTGDNQARPFILNMPVLRSQHGCFPQLFTQALSRTAPGLGTPTVGSTPQFEPNSGIEALYQIATGAGFDGNGGGTTTDSGGPASNQSQDTPGTSGDVPAVQFLAQAAPANVDDDGEPVFATANSAGVLTMITDPKDAARQIPVPASGNLGGVGWRRNAARFVILATDTATVAPTDTAPPVCPDRTLLAPPSGVFITSTDGGATAPRLADAIDICGFNGSNVNDYQPTGAQPWRSRFGLAEADKDGRNDDPINRFAGVAPLGAHTVQQTVRALNELDIEVLTLAASILTGNSTKPIPGESGELNGAPGSSIDEVSYFARTATPWTWLTAISRLTGAADAGPERVQSFDDGNSNGGLPLLYNLADVWPFDPAAANKSLGTESFINDKLVNDLADRIYHEWLQKRFLRPTTTATAPPPALRVFYDFRLEFEPIGPVTVVRADGGPNFLVLDDVLVPNWDANDPGAAQPPVSVTFPSIEWREISDSTPLPAVQSMRFKITSRFDRIQGGPGVDETSQAFLEARMLAEQLLRARGDGTYVIDPSDPSGTTLIPNPIIDLATESVCHADGTLQITVWQIDPMAASLPWPSVQLTSVAGGCAKVRDLGLLGSPTLQQGGTCPAPLGSTSAGSPLELFTCPVDLVIAATSPAGAVLTYAMPDAPVGQSVNCILPSGSTFPLGIPSMLGTTTTVTCQLLDGATMVVDTCTFDVTVVDRQAPAMQCPANIELRANDVDGVTEEPVRTIRWPDASEAIPALVAHDQVSGDITALVSCSAVKLDAPDAGTVLPVPIVSTFPAVVFEAEFALGTWLVTAVVSDEAGNVSQCEFEVRVTAPGGF